MYYLKKSWFLTSQTKTHGSWLCHQDYAVVPFIWEIHGQSIKFYSGAFIFVHIGSIKIASYV